MSREREMRIKVPQQIMEKHDIKEEMMVTIKVQRCVFGVKRMDEEYCHGSMNVKYHRHRILSECYRGDFCNVNGRNGEQ